MQPEKIFESIGCLGDLHQKGFLTDEEFHEQKSHLLLQFQATQAPQKLPLSPGKANETPKVVPIVRPTSPTDINGPNEFPGDNWAPDDFATGGNTLQRKQTKNKPISTELRPGVVFLERFELVRLLGNGAMGQVFLCDDKLLGRMEAIKVLRVPAAEQEEALEKFVNEFRLLEDMLHPGIVRVHGLFQTIDTKRTFYTMEYIEGETLAFLLEKSKKAWQNPPFPAEYSYKILLSLAQVMSYVHENGVVHRDLKPSNIMVTKEHQVKVMDFGIAKSIEDGHMTLHTHGVGSAFYMAPEQLKGDTLVTPAADVFSMGVLAYQMLTGEWPVGMAAPPSQLNSRLPVALDEVILQAMQQKPSERYQDASELHQALLQLGGLFDSPVELNITDVEQISPRREVEVRDVKKANPVEVETQLELSKPKDKALSKEPSETSEEREKKSVPTQEVKRKKKKQNPRFAALFEAYRAESHSPARTYQSVSLLYTLLMVFQSCALLLCGNEIMSFQFGDGIILAVGVVGIVALAFWWMSFREKHAKTREHLQRMRWTNLLPIPILFALADPFSRPSNFEVEVLAMFVFCLSGFYLIKSFQGRKLFPNFEAHS